MKVLKPTIGGHDGSSFREIIDIWSELKLCEVISNVNIKQFPYSNETLYPEARPWIDEVGGILLYDNPILDKLHSQLNWKFSLWANEMYQGPNASNWTFWPWHPRVHSSMVAKGNLSYDERDICSIFIGTNTTSDRVQRWNTGIEVFVLGHHSQHPISHEDYLGALRRVLGLRLV